MASSKRAFHTLFFLQVIACFCSYSLGERLDGSKYDRKETRGNSTFGCSSVGPCAPCSYSAKSDDETYHCSTTGYRQTYRCVELESDDLNGHAIGDEASSGREESSRGLYSQEISKQGLDESTKSLHGRKFEAADTTMHEGRQVIHIYFSCIPTGSDEKLSVLGFEGIMLGLLALSAPILHHRKRRNLTVAGMSRLPTSARF